MIFFFFFSLPILFDFILFTYLFIYSYIYLFIYLFIVEWSFIKSQLLICNKKTIEMIKFLIKLS